MGTKNNPGKFDCYANAEPDEPMFVLLGRDLAAPMVVGFWVQLREELARERWENAEDEKMREAKDCIAAMEEWSRKKGKDPTSVFDATVRVLRDHDFLPKEYQGLSPRVTPDLGLQHFSRADLETLLRLKRSEARAMMEAIGVVIIRGKPLVRRDDLIRYLETETATASGQKREAPAEGENNWVIGYRAAWLGVLAKAVGELRGIGAVGQIIDDAAATLQLEEAKNTLRRLCSEFGDNDWSDNLRISDVIDKHLEPHLAAERNLPKTPSAGRAPRG